MVLTGCQSAPEPEGLAFGDDLSDPEERTVCDKLEEESRAKTICKGAGLTGEGTDARYICDSGKPLDISYYNGVQPAVIARYDDDVMVMVAKKAASGSRYAQGNSEFWEHHDEAMLTWRNAETQTCKPE